MEQVSWKTYSDVHIWLNQKFGKAIACENPECAGKSSQFQYALKVGKTHKKLRGNYMTMCRTCHAGYDALHKNKGHIYDRTPRISMKLLVSLAVKFAKTPEELRSIMKFLEFVEEQMKPLKP